MKILGIVAGSVVCLMLSAGSLISQEPDNGGSAQSSEPQQMRGIFNDSMQFEVQEEKAMIIYFIDRFEKNTKFNERKGITNVYQMAPSRIMMSTTLGTREGEETNVLKLKYFRADEGGPYGKGGWCGYYSSLKDTNNPANPYFNASDYSYLTMWVKGETGAENFILGLADKHWDKAGDSVKSQQVIFYLPDGAVTKEWQKARIPLSDFLLDISRLSSLAICFESTCFPEGRGEGIVYIDDIAFE
ncbi:MAG: hypothetical protein C4541_03000 [Candidatus Auribacter fodinae]|jgi:hypothetical protein|uniref:Carbohydrate binding domain-containing protein n=1 Tax=Candidatus Auribacter fodinae TaxID=2093366 RepID=A0A3A4RHH1_9BACT|nr:MAG: hypothetical protein C4541_03000 [Candidatus Auribacter fodinae]